MLSYNSIVYIAYTLVLIVIITCLTYMNAEACSGYDLVEKTEMQDERIGKIYMGFCSVFITVVMVVFSIIWPPVLLDVPEYLSGTGEAVTGTITEFTDKIRPVEGEWALVSAKIQDENTKKIVSIKKTYFPYVQVGDQVTVSYLRHCKMGMVQEVNGKPYALERRANKAFYIIIMILLHLYFIARMLLVLKESIKSEKKYKVHIHKGRCITWIFAAEMINALGSIILAASMVGKCNTAVKIIWNILVVVFYILIFGLFMEDRYILKVNRKRIFYCDRKLRYLGQASEIKGVERTCLITDALACADSDSKEAFDPRVIIEDGVCKLADHSALAGSIATMDRLIRTVVQKAEIPLEDAVRMASETPARIMGVYDRKGSLQKGKDADILVLDEDLNVRAVWAMGKLVPETNTLF